MTDVTILGAGIFGLSIAWMCQKKGARVRVIDPDGVGAGASGGIVGALAPHVPENWNEKKAFQFESLILASDFWAEVAAASGVSPGYARLGRLQPIPDDHALALAHRRAKTATELWCGLADWRVVEASGIGVAPPSPAGFLIHDTLSARVHPRRACAALAKAIVAIGGDVTTEGPQTGKIIHATGAAGLESLSEALGAPAGAGVKGQAALLDFAAPNMPQIFADTIHIIPHEDGTTAIGSTSERDYDNPTATDDQLDDIITRARRAAPFLKEAAVIDRWAGLRPRSKSRAPILGAHPLHPDEFIANGGFKIGFGMAPLVGQVMANLALDGQDDVPAAFRI